MSTRCAIVFNCYYNGLSLVRELGKNNIPVYAMDTFRNVGTYSKYGKYVKCPDPALNETRFIDFLLEFGKRFSEKPVVFPTNDLWALTISKHFKVLSEHYILCSSNFETVDFLLKKSAFSKWGIENNFSVPRTWAFGEEEDIPQSDYPVIVKPESRRPENEHPLIFQLLDRLRLTKIYSREELKRFANEHSKLIKHFIIQESIEGNSDSMYTVGIFSYEGNVKGIFTGRKVRGYPADIGDCVVGQVEKVPIELIEEMKKICRKLKYTGIAEFEYKKDSEKNVFKLIEVNPRSWSWIGITPFCGVNLPLIAYKNMCGCNEENEVVLTDIPDGSVKYVKLLEDFYNTCFRYKRDGFSAWHKSFSGWYSSLKSDRLVIAEFGYRDLMPFLFLIVSKTGSIFRKIIK